MKSRGRQRMFRIEIAGLVIRIENRYDYVHDLCREYIIEDSSDSSADASVDDISISVSEEEIRQEAEKAPDCIFSDAYAEGVVTYEKLSNALPAFDAFVMHASVVAVDGQAYAFAAKSGTGKSTHTRYWQEVLGERVAVINGDKPICRFRGDQLIAYGTPWCGKENWQTRTSAPLKALCLLERGEENAIFPVQASEHLGELMQHFHLQGGQVDMLKMMELIDRMAQAVPMYRLRCRNDSSAAEVAADYFGI